jgi:hypothetical protein
MKRFFARFFFSSQPKPVFAEDDDATKAMRIAELKWLLSEIAAPAACTC